MDFMLKELKTLKDKRAAKDTVRPAVLLSGVYHQFAEDQPNLMVARRICIAYSRGYTVCLFDEDGEEISPWDIPLNYKP